MIAEDLGFLTPSVIKLVQKTGYPGMKVLMGVNAIMENIKAVKTTVTLTAAMKKPVRVKCMLNRCLCVMSSMTASLNLLVLFSLLALLITFY